MKQAAIGASYPTDIDERESVGLKERTTAVQNAKPLSEEIAILLVKKYVA
jgi:hypothetical protein